MSLAHRDRLLTALEANVASCGSAVVAFSAGVDSSVVLAIATRVLGERALGVLGLSPSVPPTEVAEARRLADLLGARLELVPTAELRDERYAANPPDRCFWCKTELYSVCRNVAAARGLAYILNGTNADDLGDWRPGLVAAEQAAVRSPLLDCGMGKAQVRAVARALALPNWDKPAMACLASRLPYGTRVTPARLAAIDQIEQRLRAQGFRQVRARHFGDLVRLEVEPEAVAGLQRHVQGDDFLEAVHRAGFLRVEVDPGGYRRGRLNDDLLARRSER